MSHWFSIAFPAAMSGVCFHKVWCSLQIRREEARSRKGER